MDIPGSGIGTLLPGFLLVELILYRMRSLLLSLLTIGSLALRAQVVYTEPAFPTMDEDITVYYNAGEGNMELLGVAPPIYAHTGVITDKSTHPNDWRYVQGNWGTAHPKVQMTALGNNLYAISFKIKTFYGVPTGEQVKQMAFVFRNTAGTKVGRNADGSDIFTPVYPASGALQVALFQPTVSTQLVQPGAAVQVKAGASKNASLRLLQNGVEEFSVTGKSLDHTLIAPASGFHELWLIAEAGAEKDSIRFTYTVHNPPVIASAPFGAQPGEHAGLPGQYTFLITAPAKSHVYLLSDRGDWEIRPEYQLNRTPDGVRYWITIDSLPGDFSYQYLVDGQIRIADPLSRLVLDPWNDAGIPASVWPGLPSYPVGRTSGIVSLLRTSEPAYDWKHDDYDRPLPTEMVVYELLLRDFLESRDFKTLKDTLDYLQRLGVDAVELMPVSEFEANDSWGYNVSFHRALDKYYGRPEDLKALVDACHERGIAVILDVVFNHAFGQSPLSQLYWDAANSRPAANNPWLNPIARHPFNVGYDFNHESPFTRQFVKQVLRFWMEEFHVDGFRFDLSKGFTQVNTGSNVDQWGQYDGSRIAILKDYADAVWAVDPGAYMILEHFAANSEEKLLANYGMQLWGNMNYAYNEASMGFGGTSLAGVTHKSRDFLQPHLIGYKESHDEERLMYKNLQFGNSGSGYSVKDKATALRRQELVSAFFYTLPGPKMLWQFGELGYDFSINRCTNGTVDPSCRLVPKPVRWDYLQDPDRKRLFEVTRALLHLRREHPVFREGDWNNNDLGSAALRSLRLTHPDMDAVIVGNFQVTPGQLTPAFPKTGWWYDYLGQDSLLVTDLNAKLALEPGEYRIYTSSRVDLPDGSPITSKEEVFRQEGPALAMHPNPASGRVTARIRAGTPWAGRISVVDALGRPLFSATVDVPEGGLDFPIERDLPAGVYRVVLEGGGPLVVGQLLVVLPQ